MYHFHYYSGCWVRISCALSGSSWDWCHFLYIFQNSHSFDNATMLMSPYFAFYDARARSQLSLIFERFHLWNLLVFSSFLLSFITSRVPYCHMIAIFEWIFLSFYWNDFFSLLGMYKIVIFKFQSFHQYLNIDCFRLVQFLWVFFFVRFILQWIDAGKDREKIFN